MKFRVESLKRQRALARLEGEGVLLDVHFPGLPAQVGQSLELVVLAAQPATGWTYVAQGVRLPGVQPPAYSCGGLLAQAAGLPEVAGTAFVCVR
jgi:hypothetical protein